MGLSDILALVNPQTAVGFAIGAMIGCFAFWKELIVPGPRYRAALKRIDRLERRVRVWQRLYMVSKLTAEKAAGLPELELDLEESE